MSNDNKKDGNCQSDVQFAVYVIWCKITNRFYVGVTSQKYVYTRIRQHKRGKQFIDLEIQALGWEDNFDWWVVEENIPANLISVCEQKWIAFYNSVFPDGYNKTFGGIGNIIVSEDTRAKIRENALARDLSGENNPMYGKHHTEAARQLISEARKVENLSDETRARMSEAQKGKKLSDKTRAKISEASMGEKNHFYGKHHTEEAKEKNRQAHLVKHPSEKTRAQMSESHKRENLSEETLAKMSESHTGEKNHFYGKHHTEEAKEKNRQAHLGQVAWNKGIPASEKARAKMSESHKRENLSAETLAKMSESHKGKESPMKGKHHSEETKAKIREKALARAAAKRAAKLAETAAAENSANQTTS